MNMLMTGVLSYRLTKCHKTCFLEHFLEGPTEYWNIKLFFFEIQNRDPAVHHSLVIWSYCRQNCVLLQTSGLSTASLRVRCAAFKQLPSISSLSASFSRSFHCLLPSESMHYEHEYRICSLFNQSCDLHCWGPNSHSLRHKYDQERQSFFPVYHR